MKKSVFLLTAMIPIGCLFDEEKKNPAPKQVAAGLYAGDYKWVDSSAENTVESELILDPNGTYRHTVLWDNVARVGSRGDWEPRDASLVFSRIEMGRASGGEFYLWQALKADEAMDTTATKNVTDSSFVRREYTVFRQKPYWITYTKRTPDRIPEGDFLNTSSYQVDSTKTVVNRTKLRLGTGKAMTLSGSEDSLETFQATAIWYQVGSFLVYKEYRYRNYDDSLKGFPAAWDTVPGEIFSRVGAISDTVIQIWVPAQFIFSGKWNDYKRVL